ncbi:MAG: hypothetical protein JSU83_15240 [Deltaproteobacteria bacterium]|nr:MAG: hypothetical protein JSU83_15240 [Deltaproteobacteria bacterium]
MAYRQMIHAALRAREVNDTNGLMGYTLYTLKFDSPSCRKEFIRKMRSEYRYLDIKANRIYINTK